MKIEDIFIDSINKKIRFLIGTSAKVNFNIIDVSESGDLWFHADDYSSCHVIAEMPANNFDISEIISIGAGLCVNNTKKLKNKNKVTIIYDYIRNISKSKEIGGVDINEETIKYYSIQV